ncbi:MAG: type VI secretion system-associated protein TagF [Burkholderiales bacterium]
MGAAAAGWHGKLPTLGDFASRRLSPSFIEVWDRWLSEEIDALKRADPQGWLQAYLDSPVWRFVLMPGALPGEAGRHAWAGVLMPSVDRVGRYFPFTIAHPFAPQPQGAQPGGHLLEWLHQLDDAAAEALHDDWSVERLEAELLRLPPPIIDALPAGDHINSTFWTAVPPEVEPRSLASPGLPCAGQFAALLGRDPTGPAPAR